MHGVILRQSCMASYSLAHQGHVRCNFFCVLRTSSDLRPQLHLLASSSSARKPRTTQHTLEYLATLRQSDFRAHAPVDTAEKVRLSALRDSALNVESNPDRYSTHSYVLTVLCQDACASVTVHMPTTMDAVSALVTVLCIPACPEHPTPLWNVRHSSA